jgi:DNA (cytosine-5)-methyltransferase 1
LPTVAALFAGVGGLELGLKRSGFRTVFACEIDKTAQQLLRVRFPEARLWSDIQTLRALPSTTVVTAGFPCQDLSQAGLTAGLRGSQSGLITEVFRLLKHADPEWVVLENVPFMLHLNRGRALKFVLSQLQALQFRWAYRIVDTRAFGLPQRRRRVIIVASRRNDPRQVLLSDDAPENRAPDVGTAFGFYWTEGNTGLGWAVNAIPPLKRGSAFGIASPPAIWCQGEGIMTPDIRDAERLQGFPPGWTSLGRGTVRVSARWHFLGNAVSVPVSRWIGRRLNRPKSYDSEKDPKLTRGGRWPTAAWWMGNGIHISSVTEYPVSRSFKGLDTFLRFPPTPLSITATAGFLERARASSLRFAPGFLDALETHLQVLEKASA